MFPNFQYVSSYVPVRTEDEAKNYPVAYGNSVIFKSETAPYMYVKTMGFSQSDRPVFEAYKLVTENDDTDSLDKIKTDISSLWKEVNALKKKRRDDNEHTTNL